MRSGAVDRFERRLFAFGRTNCGGSRRRRDRRGIAAAPRIAAITIAPAAADWTTRRRTGTPIRSQIAAIASPPAVSARDDEDRADTEEAVLERAQHRRWHVRRQRLPPAAASERDELVGPGADGDAERDDRRRGRMVGHRRRRHRDRDRQCRMERVTERQVDELGQRRGAAVSRPQRARRARRRGRQSGSPRTRPVAFAATIVRVETRGCCSRSLSAPL